MNSTFLAPPVAARRALALAIALVSPCLAASALPTVDDPDPPPVTSSNGPPDEALATLSEVEVLAEPFFDLRSQRARTPGGVSLVDGREFRSRAIGNLADALRQVPGVWATSSSGADNGFISIRGSNLDATDYDNNGVLLLQDGLPVSAADGSNHNRFIDPLTAREVAVVRGANALAWGATNLGGAIDFISRTARNSGPDEVHLQVGSHGFQAARAGLGAVDGPLDGLLVVEARNFDGYRKHSRQRRHSLYANGGWLANERLSLRAFVSHIDNREQLAGALSRAEFAVDPWQANDSAARGNHQLNVRTDRLALKATLDQGGGHWLELGGSHEEQDLYHPIVDVLVDVGGPEPINVFNLLIDTTQRNRGAMARQHLEFENHHLLLGANLIDTRTHGGNYGNRAGARGALQDVVDKHASAATLFVLDHWRLTPGWSLVYGAQVSRSRRLDNNIDAVGEGAVDPRDQRDRFRSVNPRFGVLRHLDRLGELYASFGRVHEAPSDMDLDSARTERGAQATLRAMRGRVAELGWRGSLASGPAQWQWDVSAWHTWLRDPIVSMDDPEHPGLTLTANASRSRLLGADAWLAASLPVGRAGARIEPRLSASWNAFAFDHDPVYGNNRLPSAPRALLHAELLWRFAQGYYLGPTLDAVGARRADYANSYRVAGHGLAGFRAGLRRDRWEMFIEASNLADKAHVATLAVRDRAAADAQLLYPGAPRTVRVGLRLDY